MKFKLYLEGMGDPERERKLRQFNDLALVERPLVKSFHDKLSSFKVTSKLRTSPTAQNLEVKLDYGRLFYTLILVNALNEVTGLVDECKVRLMHGATTMFYDDLLDDKRGEERLSLNQLVSKVVKVIHQTNLRR